MQCKLFQKGSIHCVQAGSGALYFELTIDQTYADAKVNTVIRYSPIHNLLAQKVILNAGRKFFLIVGHTQPHQTTRKQFTVVLYHRVVPTGIEAEVEAYVGGGLRLPYETLVTANQSHVITSGGSYSISEKMEVKKSDVGKLVDVYGGSVFDQDKIPDPEPEPVDPDPKPKPDEPVDPEDPDKKPKPKPDEETPEDKKDKETMKKEGSKIGSFILWTVVSLAIVGAIGYGYIAYRKHSALKNRYYTPRGKLRSYEDKDDDDDDTFLNSRDDSLSRSNLKLE